MHDLQTTIKNVRITHVAFLLSVLLIPFIAEQIVKSGVPAYFVRVLRFLFSPIAIAMSVFALFYRTRTLQTAAEELQRNPQDKGALRKWESSHFIAFSSCEAVAMIGFVYRIAGGPTKEAAVFYVAGLVLLLLLTPRAEFAR